MADKITPYGDDMSEIRTEIAKLHIKSDEIKNLVIILIDEVRETKCKKSFKKTSHPTEIIVQLEPPPIAVAAVAPYDKWLDIKNRPKPEYKRPKSTHPLERFKTACREYGDFFERHYNPEIGAKFENCDKKSFMKLAEALWNEIRSNSVRLIEVKEEMERIFS